MSATSEAHRLLSAVGLACERDGRALFSALDLVLHAGEVLWVRGGNGSGKTTLLRGLLGLAPDVSGRVTLDGDRPPLYLGHRLGLSAPLTCAENLQWLGALAGAVPDAQAVETALAATGMAGHARVPVADLSAGQQRRVALARLCLALPGGLWLLDEPLTALDTTGVRLVEACLAAHAAAGGAALVTSHQPLSVATRELHLDRGAS